MTLILDHIDASSNKEFDNHKTILKAVDPKSGLKAFIAVHDTTIGPGLGGCRYWSGYASEDEALTDALRLSRGMTYKNALAHLPLGGGKSVIMGQPGRKTPTREEMLSFGRAVESLNGDYITAEDVGISVEDMTIVSEVTSHVTGLAHDDKTVTSGDPSPYTAYGVFLGIKASVKHKMGKDDLTDIKVAVAGLGHVGMDLCRRLHEAGAELMVSDIRQDVLDEAVQKYGATILSTDDFVSADVDVLAPCALGNVVNDDTIDSIKAPIIAGAANNQLGTASKHGKVLHDRGILYAPDYVINAGGVISVAMSGEKDTKTIERLEELGETLAAIFRQSERLNMPTFEVSDKIAEKIISDKAGAEDFTAAREQARNAA